MANQAEIIEMAKQSGMGYDDKPEVYIANIDDLKDFVKLVEARKCKELAAKIERMPFGATAESFAQWVRDQA